MNVSCNVIRDLLPLYAEKLTSPDSNRLVEEHLTDCPECSRQLSLMQKAAPMPVEVDTDPLEKIRQIMRKRWALTALTAVLLVVTIVCQGVLLLDATVYLTPEQAVESVEVKENGNIVLHMTGYVNGYGMDTLDETGTVWGIVATSNLQKLLFESRESYDAYMQLAGSDTDNIAQEAEYYPGTLTIPAGVKAVWYCDGDTGMAQTRLWGNGDEQPTQESILSVGHEFVVYHALLLTLAVLSGVAAYLLRKKRFASVGIYLAMAFASVSVSTFVVSAGQLVSRYGEFTEHVQEGLLCAIPMFLTLVCGYWLYRLSRH